MLNIIASFATCMVPAMRQVQMARKAYANRGRLSGSFGI